MSKVSIVENEGKILMEVHVYSETMDVPLLTFVWPKLWLEDFEKLKRGDDFDHQDDEGLFMKQRDKVLNIEMRRGEDSEDSIVINLPYDVLGRGEIFEALTDLQDKCSLVWE
jgi:hypothetical protein